MNANVMNSLFIFMNKVRPQMSWNATFMLKILHFLDIYVLFKI